MQQWLSKLFTIETWIILHHCCMVHVTWIRAQCTQLTLCLTTSGVTYIRHLALRKISLYALLIEWYSGQYSSTITAAILRNVKMCVLWTNTWPTGVVVFGELISPKTVIGADLQMSNFLPEHDDLLTMGPGRCIGLDDDMTVNLTHQHLPVH